MAIASSHPQLDLYL